jgi:hypothetical protein
MFVIGIIGCESFISFPILSIQMLVKCNGFDFEYIKSSIFSIFGYGIWSLKIDLILKFHHVVENMHHFKLH